MKSFDLPILGFYAYFNWIGIVSRAEEKKDLDEKVIQAGLFNRNSSEQEH